MWRVSARPSSSTRTARRALAVALASLLAIALLRSSAGAGPESTTEARARVTQLAHKVDGLEKRAELATGDDFYLLIDLVDSNLFLMLQGALLRAYHFQGLEVGTPRVAFRQRDLGGNWVGRIWSEGNLVPPRPDDRIEIIPPDSTALADSTPPPVKIPPTPEEKYPVPHRYHVRYAGGLSLEVLPQQLDSSLTMWKRVTTGLLVWGRDVRAAVGPKPEDTVRLRLVMRPEDAASLYRAMPPKTRLLVLPTESS